MSESFIINTVEDVLQICNYIVSRVNESSKIDYTIKFKLGRNKDFIVQYVYDEKTFYVYSNKNTLKNKIIKELTLELNKRFNEFYSF